MTIPTLGSAMIKPLVGAGGWAYFQVQGNDKLRAYASVFDFVEVNSTYYEFPSLTTVRGWATRVPRRFEFSVRCNKGIVEALGIRGQMLEGVMSKMEEICRILRANILSILIPKTIRISETGLESGVAEAISSFRAKGTRIAVETRARVSKKVLRIMQENDAIHCVDISKEIPAYDSGVLYSRLFGKGKDNIYQFDDEELRDIGAKASAPRYEKSILAFHGVRMYGDAARLKSFLQTGKFMRVTGQTGLDSLVRVMKEDANFPISKSELVAREGWKLFDLTFDHRVRAKTVLSKLPNKTYHSLQDVIVSLEGRSLPRVQASRAVRAKTQNSSQRAENPDF